ncbi:tetratricopeptide repeat protein [Armatimonas sp.]|uniref:tetratricopeptide repeat protein n=1 Tax=Armatimonas sp. TaxID=1872638 RepID=UPI00286CAC6E|nr:tetratricopeptide repeat protein [Armatimonas sp.]
MSLSPKLRLLILGGGLLGLAVGATLSLRLLSQNAALSRLVDRGFQATQAGQYAQAEQLWGEARRLAPDNPLVLRSLAETLRLQGRWDEAKATYAELARRAPQEPHVHCQLAALTLQNPQDPQAQERVEQAVAREPACVSALLLAIRRANQLGDQKKELGYLAAAYQAEKRSPALTTYYATQLQNSADLKTALVVTRDYSHRYPGYGYANAFSGFLASRLSEKDAQDTLERAVRLDPSSGLAHAALGFHLHSRGKSREAVPYLENALLLGFDQADLLFNLTRAWRTVGRTADADRLQKSFDTLSAAQNLTAGLQRRHAPSAELEPALQKLAEARQVFATERQRLETAP